MTTFTAQDLEERLLDYVYDELEPEERAAFEAALPSAPAVAAELAAMRETRTAMAELGTPTLPAGFDANLAAVFAEADAAAAGFRAAEAPQPVAAPPKVAPAATGGGPGFWARLGQRLAASLATPAFATAAVALIVTGVAVTMARKGDLPGADRSATSQEIGAVAPVAVAAEAPAPSAAAAPEPETTALADAPAPPAEKEEATEGLAAGAAADRGGLLDSTASAPAPESARRERASLEQKVAAPAKKLAAKLDNALDKVANGRGQAASEDTKAAAADLMASADGVRSPQQASNTTEPATGHVALGDSPSEPYGYAEARRPAKPAPPSVPARDDREFAPAPPPADEAADEAVDDLERVAKPAAQPQRTSTASVPSGAKDADRAEEEAASLTARRIDGLWTTLRRQLEAGDLDAADRTLAELARLGGDAARIKAAKAEVADARARAAEAAKASPKKATTKGSESDALHPATRSTK